MIKERRLYSRQVINRIAKFQSGVGSLPRDCFVTDVSERGARLYAEGVEVPHTDREDEIGALARAIRIFQEAMDRNRLKALDELAAQAQELGMGY